MLSWELRRIGVPRVVARGAVDLPAHSRAWVGGTALRERVVGGDAIGVEDRQGPVGDVGITDGGFEDSAAPDQVVDELTYGLTVPDSAAVLAARGGRTADDTDAARLPLMPASLCEHRPG
ncbi:hypothetical protein [Streptomyces sp. 3213.3]|uniref:hypothetical protein n=1 Tax=Streptomyces sp. 3213.3 TaxID=1855348 RepID=UPI000B816113|nr:hypothetical protein [Streptomyces sp. 3213.3]